MDGPKVGIVPVGILDKVAPAPAAILKMIKCGCSTISPCSSMCCSCSSARLSCSVFCRCHADESCRNKQTIAASQQNDEDNYMDLIEVRQKLYRNNILRLSLQKGSFMDFLGEWLIVYIAIKIPYKTKVIWYIKNRMTLNTIRKKYCQN